MIPLRSTPLPCPSQLSPGTGPLTRVNQSIPAEVATMRSTVHQNEIYLLSLRSASGQKASKEFFPLTYKMSAASAKIRIRLQAVSCGFWRRGDKYTKYIRHLKNHFPDMHKKQQTARRLIRAAHSYPDITILLALGVCSVLQQVLRGPTWREARVFFVHFLFFFFAIDLKILHF